MFFFQILKSLEKEKVTNSIELCSMMKLHGKCCEFNCPKRHILDKNLDLSKFLPKSGRIRFEIIDIHDLTHFSIHLIEHIDDNNKVIVYDIKDITEELTDTLKINKKRISESILGHYYAYYCSETELFYRCRLLKIDKDNIRIILIDRGNVIDTLKSKIFHLPNEFSVNYYPEKSK